MGKVAGMMTAVFMVSSGTMALLSGVMGGMAEAAAVGVMGLGMVAASSALSGKLATPPSVAKEA